MTGITFAGILRFLNRIASTPSRRGLLAWTILVCLHLGPCWGQKPSTGGVSKSPTPSHVPLAAGSVEPSQGLTQGILLTRDFDFGPNMGQIRQLPIGWKRQRGIAYKTYVKIRMVREDAGSKELVEAVSWLDGKMVFGWQWVRDHNPWNPHLNLINRNLGAAWSLFSNALHQQANTLPPSLADSFFNRYLRVDLNGSGALVSSPTLPADASHQYRFGCRLMTDLQSDSARVEFVFGKLIAEKGAGAKPKLVLKELAVHSTPWVGGETPWATFRLPLVSPPAETTHLIARLVVEGGSDGIGKIPGVVGFDDIRIEEKPQLEITTNQPRGIYQLGETVLANAGIAGHLPADVKSVRFELYDIHQRLIANTTMPIEQEVEQPVEGTNSNRSRTELDWQIPGLQPGFYRMTVALVGGRELKLNADTTIAVIQPLGDGSRGLFGWTLESGHQGMAPVEFADWLSQLGVMWVKYPCWLPVEDNKAALDEVESVLSRLQDARIQTVGMIDQPPPEHLGKFSEPRELVAAEVFRDAGTWQGLLEPVIRRFEQKVITWQLGGERDFSFLGLSRMPEVVKEISEGLAGSGHPVDVTLSWPWLERSAPSDEASWTAVSRSSSPPLSAVELDAFLTRSDAVQSTAGLDGPRTWLLIDPLDVEVYDRETRIRDMVLRMATARSHRVQAAFVSNPHDPQHGLLRLDGRPAEMLLPWRTTSLLLGNLRAVGVMRLRSQAVNQVYVNSKRAVVLMWADQATEELAYFGEGAKMVDVWGNVTPLQTLNIDGQTLQRVPIGPTPVFLIGCDPAVLAFRMSVDMGDDRLDSPLGRTQEMTIAFTNPLRESLIGGVRILPPPSWRVSPEKQSWKMLGGQDTLVSFDVVLSNTATIGEYEIPIQFTLETNPPETVTVYRKVRVGPDGIEMKVETRLLPNGDLRVELVVINRTAETRFYNCLLFPPVGAFVQRQVAVPAGDEVRRRIDFKNGARMIGSRFRVRAVEQKQQRVMNYEVEIKR